ncbi:unnamed protein product [Caenorhabditis angaria]|uniref:C2H2-type domain-containing protein n=1 Tax=Caenorhabditis angaria TaxID=860376 RepID=A0A9P1MVW9_9PELO|nr:unnamed protein product [Caenorhabditis angaria]
MVSVFKSQHVSSMKISNRRECPQQDCFWRGPTDMALRKHMQVHGAKQPVIYSGNKPNGTNSNDPQVKVQLVQPKPKGVKCSECDTFAYSRPLLLRHMHDSHGIEAPLIRRTFANREMLQTWLDSLRETHAVEFVVSSGSKKWGRGLQVHYLTCSRSGDQKERPNKKYVRPPRPSIKCGRNCMAYLKIKQNPTVSELQIEGCLHHSGHEIDHTRMMLEPNELSSVGCIVDAVNEGMDIMGSVETLRSYLGNSGRFRLVNDRGIIEQMPVWFDQYHRAMSDYMNDGSHPIPSMYRGSGALAIPATQNGQPKSGRRFNFAMNRDIKREMDYEYKSVPIRFNGNTIQRNYGQQQSFTPTLYDEKKIKIEIDEEENLASQSLLNNENCLMEMKHEDIFDSPMIGGEESRLLEDDDILCGGEEASGITSTIDGILNANLPDNFGDVMCGVDDLNTDFNCGMDDAEFNELLGFDFDQRGSINCS